MLDLCVENTSIAVIQELSKSWEDKEKGIIQATLKTLISKDLVKDLDLRELQNAYKSVLEKKDFSKLPEISDVLAILRHDGGYSSSFLYDVTGAGKKLYEGLDPQITKALMKVTLPTGSTLVHQLCASGDAGAITTFFKNFIDDANTLRTLLTKKLPDGRTPIHLLFQNKSPASDVLKKYISYDMVPENTWKEIFHNADASSLRTLCISTDGIENIIQSQPLYNEISSQWKDSKNVDKTSAHNMILLLEARSRCSRKERAYSDREAFYEIKAVVEDPLLKEGLKSCCLAGNKVKLQVLENLVNEMSDYRDEEERLEAEILVLEKLCDKSEQGSAVKSLLEKAYLLKKTEKEKKLARDNIINTVDLQGASPELKEQARAIQEERKIFTELSSKRFNEIHELDKKTQEELSKVPLEKLATMQKKQILTEAHRLMLQDAEQHVSEKENTLAEAYVQVLFFDPLDRLSLLVKKGEDFLSKK